MSDAPADPTPESVDSLIEDLRSAQRDRTNARNWMSLLVAVVVVGFLIAGAKTFIDFQKHGTEPFGEAMQEEITRIAPMAEAELTAAANRLFPVYQDAFATTIERDQELYYEVLADEYLGLQLHAEQAWPKIEEAIAELVIAQEETARAKLSQYIAPDELDRINQAFAREMTLRLENLFQRQYGEQLVIAEDMVAKLEQIAATETELPPDDTQYILGMFLELLGIEMQMNAETVADNR